MILEKSQNCRLKLLLPQPKLNYHKVSHCSYNLRGANSKYSWLDGKVRRIKRWHHAGVHPELKWSRKKHVHPTASRVMNTFRYLLKFSTASVRNTKTFFELISNQTRPSHKGNWDGGINFLPVCTLQEILRTLWMRFQTQFDYALVMGTKTFLVGRF